MKKIHRIMLILMSCVVVISVSSCGRKLKSGQMNREVLFWAGLETYMGNVALYRPNGQNRPLYYFDVTTKAGGVFCFDPTCEHKMPVRSEKGELIEQGCPAYDYSELAVYLTGDYMYYYSSNCLYRADRQGNNRKTITKLSKPYGIPMACCYTDEALYISYSFSYEYYKVEKEDGELEWRVGELREKPEIGLLRIPYSGEGEEEIYHTDEYYEATIGEIECCDGQIVFFLMWMDRPSNFVDMMNDPDWKAKADEERRHTFIEAYDYRIATGDLKQLFAPRQCIASFFFSETYGFLDDYGTLGLYRYDGEEAVKPEIGFWRIYPSTHDIIGWDYEKRGGVMVSEKTGKVIKESPLTWEDFNLYLAVGESYYGMVDNYKAYISAADFWAGNKDGIIILPGQQ